MAKNKNNTAKETERQIIKKELFGLALIALSLIISISLYVMSQGMLTTSTNPGALGSFFVRIAEGLMGGGKFLFPLALFYLGIRYIKDNIRIKYDLRFLGVVLFIFSFLMGLHMQVNYIDYSSYLKEGLQGIGGGLIGAILVLLFRTFFGLWGAWIISGTFFVAGVMMITGFSLKNILTKMHHTTQTAWQNNKDTILDSLFVEEEISTTSEHSLPRAQEIEKADEKRKKFVLIDMSDHKAKPHSFERIDMEKEMHQITTDELEPEVLEDEVKVELESSPSITGISEFRLPPLSLLDSVSMKKKNVPKCIDDRSYNLEKTLQSFGINAKVTQVTCGPAVTRFELDIPAGVKISKIIGLSQDIALNLAAKSVRVAPIPDRAAIGIELPNKEISAVSFREVLENNEFLNASSKLTFVLGKDISGQPVIADLTKMPHLLVAGTTGSGKSVCMNTLICSILFKATPKDVRFIMIDPKMVELAGYNGIPHLLAPVVTDVKKASAILKWVVSEMENRYEMFANSSVKDIVRYNIQKTACGNDLQKMPYYVVIIDELADLMMVAAQDVEESILRLAQMARAAGIHLVVATQRPSVDVITGIIKANIPSRIAFAVSSLMDSRTILDSAGAEKLLGRGDMLFHPVGEPTAIRIQGAFVSDKEVENIVSYLKKSSEPQYDKKVMEVEAVKSDETGLDSEEDPYFQQAGKILIETGQASISMLQRRMRVGYSRAARLIDMLEAKGVVGGHEGSKARNILMSIEEFENIFSKDKKED